MIKANLINIRDIVHNIDHIVAHTDSGKKDETLIEHSQQTLYYFEKLNKEKGIGHLLEKMIENLKCADQRLDKEYIQWIKDMFVNAIYLHDIGKINPAFQKEKMENTYYEHETITNTSHSIFSSMIYIDLFNEKLKTVKSKVIKYFLYNILYSFAYQISRHHSHLKDMHDFLDSLDKAQKAQKRGKANLKEYKSNTVAHIDFGIDNELNNRKRGYEKWKMDGVAFYILNKLLFALIVACDHYATYHYHTGREVDLGIIKDVHGVLDIYHQYKVYQDIEKYKETGIANSEINRLRCEIFEEAERRLLNHIDSNIFYLEAPTGSGKTNVSINLALKLVEKMPQVNKVFYIFPFNTLVEQTKKTFDDIFQNKINYTVVNSITPVATGKKETNEEKTDYKKIYLNRQFLHYPFVITTHINFFNYLFGCGREVNFPLVHLCNSVVILDEIQSYRNAIWKEIIIFLEKYAQLLNIKIIVMSATLPKLDALLDKQDTENNFISLVKNRDKYFKNPVFKDRVNLNYEMLGQPNIKLEDIRDKIEQIIKQRNDQPKILVEFIRKDTARDFYNLIKDHFKEYEVFELSGDDNKFFRDEVIEKIKSGTNMIVVATQVIEAGVDIDMDIGFKDISLFDSEEQFLGRINRSCGKPDSRAYFFNYDNADKIYRNDLRRGMDLNSEAFRNYLQNKNFEEFYKNTFRNINDIKAELNPEKNIKAVLNEAMRLEFNAVSERMKLIEQRTFQLYIPYANKKYDGEKLWEEYKALYEDKKMEYTEKQVNLSILNEKMSLFTFNLIAYDSKTPIYAKEQCGCYYYVENEFEDGKFFVKGDKFDRKAYQQKAGGLFL
ncbi:MAG: CRISPR-associated helicase Cas3' [Firmicutes bacterium]|nr:CRISPR-associated helicase Cas3' [Bacillota bacterium]